MNPDKVDVCLVRISLGDKACEKGNDFAVLFDGKTRFSKIDEEYSWQKVGHLSTAPPIVKNCDNRVVVAFFQVPDFHVRLLAWRVGTLDRRSARAPSNAKTHGRVV